jgi:peptidyl-prolyl cis-trans isomerase D
MLESLRNASKGWLGFILIIVVVASFGLLFNVQDMIGLVSTPSLATVGDRQVTSDEFQREFTRFLREMERQSNAQLSSTEAKKLGLDREALDRLLTRLALLEKATDIGLDISQDQLIESIASIRGMSDGRGGINPEALQQLLQQAQLSQAEFLDIVRGDILREQLIRTMLSGVVVPAGLEAALQRFRLERRVVEYILIDPSRAGEIKAPSEATLRKFYEAEAQRYSLPEFRTVTVAVARPSDVASQVQVTDDEIKRAYEANRRTYETPEKRVLQQIRFKSEAAAREGKKKLDAGQAFEAVAQAEGFKPEDINLGEVSKSDTTIPAAAFEIALNAASEPVKGPFGWVILRALSSTPGSLKTLDEVRAEIRERFVTERSKEKLFELTNAFEDTLGGGDTLEEAAKKHNIAIVKARIDARGNDGAGNAVEGLPGGDFLQRLFAAERGDDSGLLDTGDGVYYEFRVDEVTPSAKKPFGEVRADVLADWRAAELNKRLQAMADGLVKRGNGGEKMSAIAGSLGLAPLMSDPLPRYGMHAIFGPATLGKAHEAKVGGYFSGPVTDGKSLVVGRLAEIQYASEPPDSPDRGRYASHLRESFAADLAEQFANSVRQEVGVTINEKRFQEFHSGGE